jgi:quercetin dioxygenase-like cupin family protein
MDNPADSRLRPHPETRFAAEQIQVDLPAIVARLRSEPQAGERGHRQETLYHGRGLTMALFLFDRFTHLAEHQANGIVSMHVLRGRLKISAADKVHELQTGQMLILAPGVRHAVSAEEESEMLVTVRLTPAGDATG